MSVNKFRIKSDKSVYSGHSVNNINEDTYTVGNVGTLLNELAAKFKSITKIRFRTKKKKFFRMKTTADISIQCITNIQLMANIHNPLKHYV